MNVTQKVFLAGGDKDVERAFSAADQILADLFRVINALDFGTIEDGAPAANFNGRWLLYTTNGVANTDDTKRHKLGRVPVSFLQFERPNKTGETPNSGQVYWGTGPSATDLTVTLRCTVASKQVYVLIF